MPYYYTHSAHRYRAVYLTLTPTPANLRARVAAAHNAGRAASASYGP